MSVVAGRGFLFLEKKEKSMLSMENLWLEDDFAAVPEMPEVPVAVAKKLEVVNVVHQVIDDVFSKTRVWPKVDLSVLAPLSADVAKYNANMQAIRLRDELLSRHAAADSDDDRLVLNQFTGWGGLPKVFNDEISDSAWLGRVGELKGLLNVEEYGLARSSVNTSFYTPPNVIEFVWQVVERLGFKGGKILEPSAGVGHFLALMPENIIKRSSITTVEIDSFTADIVSLLYQDFGVKTMKTGLEKAPLPNDFYDLVIGNVPFGDFQVAELKNVPYRNFLIHDYFIARSVDLVRDGGLVAVLTSTGTMDKVSSKVRNYLSTKVKLLGAVRLPWQAFASTGTSVTVDCLFFQKTKSGDVSWLRSSIVPDDHLKRQYTYHKFAMNDFFINKPDFICGNLVTKANGYTPALAVAFDGGLTELMTSKVSLFPENCYVPSQKVGVYKSQRRIETERSFSENIGSYVVFEGDLVVIEANGVVVPVGASKTVEDRIRGMIAIRDACRTLINRQVVEADDRLLQQYRDILNDVYDDFVAQHGYLHAKANRMAFREDPSLPLLLSLEKFDDVTGLAEKVDIFTMRTVAKLVKVERCTFEVDALLASIQEHGCVDLSYMAKLMAKPEDVVLAELIRLDAVYQNPITNEYEMSAVYLSGNVRVKLLQAESAGAGFERNVAALQKIIPVDLLPDQISARLGSTWIPGCYYERFIVEVLGEGSGDAAVSFERLTGTWHVKPGYMASRSVTATQVYGTSRSNGVELMGLAMNQQVPTITDPDPFDSSKRKINQTETIAAREKQHDLKVKFTEWLWSDAGRADHLVRIYNDQFNSIVSRDYSGMGLNLPGFSMIYNLYEHQKNGVWRIVSSEFNTLLAHVVGAGKTLTMICASMELRRLGKASKPGHVVPNHMLEQYSSEFLRAYPNANLLMVSKDDLTGKNRRQFLARVATGNWDAVVLTHSSFESLKMSEGHIRATIMDLVRELESIILVEENSRTNKAIKILEKAKKDLLARLDKLANTRKKDDFIGFEQLGIDFLFVDEAHYFKNVYRVTKMSRVAGLPNSHSERAFDMLLKTRFIMSLHDMKRGIVFATGTPISNTMAEMWVMQNYLQPLTLAENFIQSFDAWVANFGESVTALELAPDGSSYRMHTRFARFLNVPELMGMFYQVADIQTADMLNLPVPKVKEETISIPRSEKQGKFVDELVLRATQVANGCDPSVDNMLKVTGDGKKAALDMRLVDGQATELDGSKVPACAEKVFFHWQDSMLVRGTQIVFCDLGTPSDIGRFSVYSALKARLIDLGIPANEVAFIHDYDTDAQKGSLFKMVRDGVIRVLVGSTLKLGVGTNVQTRLIALHHLDGPWRPADIAQRDGRIVRQGNLNDLVYVYRYVTERSFDAYVWQTLETKARFIAQVMSGQQTGIRSVEDVELVALSFAEVKALASGNPLVLEKAAVDTELVKLQILYSRWKTQQWHNSHELQDAPAFIASKKSNIASIEADMATKRSTLPDLVLDGSYSFKDKAVIRKALYSAVHAVGLSFGARIIGAFGEFKLSVSQDSFLKTFKLVLLGQSGMSYSLSVDASQWVDSLVDAYLNFDKFLAAENKSLEQFENRMLRISQEINKPFDKIDRLEYLMKRQLEIVGLLDIDKDDASAASLSEEVAVVDDVS